MLSFFKSAFVGPRTPCPPEATSLDVKMGQVLVVWNCQWFGFLVLFL